jgi:hypothetical protein
MFGSALCFSGACDVSAREVLVVSDQSLVVSEQKCAY